MKRTTSDSDLCCMKSTRCRQNITASSRSSVKRRLSSQRWKISLAILLLSASSFSTQAWTTPSLVSSQNRVTRSFREVEDAESRQIGTFQRRRLGILKDASSSTVGYIPDGLTADEYMKIKRKDAAKLQGSDDIDSSSMNNNKNNIDFFQVLKDARESYEMMAMTTATGIILSAYLM